MLFDKKWFLKYQKILLWFANTWIGKRVLCIYDNKSSIGKNKIIGILPNAIFWKGNKENEYKAEFRTHDKFAKRIYCVFYPLWYLFHLWDKIIANSFQPKWNLGFDTLTVYPAAGANSPVDGWVARSGQDESFASLRGGVGDSAGVTETSQTIPLLQASATSNQFQRMFRDIYCFDTSPLGASAVISATVFSLASWLNAGITKFNSLNPGDPDLHCVGSTPASTSNLVGSDYQNVQFTSFGSVTYVNWSNSDQVYNDFSLNASGIANISLTGISKFGAILSWDQANSFGGTWSNVGYTDFQHYYADQTGTANDPKLVVTYTLLPTTGASFLLTVV